jgi:hypothetical protein
MLSATKSGQVRLAELVAALSLGIDLGFSQPMEHMLRQCLIALRLAERSGLDDQERAVVYYTALLTGVGCHSTPDHGKDCGQPHRPHLFENQRHEPGVREPFRSATRASTGADLGHPRHRKQRRWGERLMRCWQGRRYAQLMKEART